MTKEEKISTFNTLQEMDYNHTTYTITSYRSTPKLGHFVFDFFCLFLYNETKYFSSLLLKGETKVT